MVDHPPTGEFVGTALAAHVHRALSTATIVDVSPLRGWAFRVDEGDVDVRPAPYGGAEPKTVKGANGNLYLR